MISNKSLLFINYHSILRLIHENTKATSVKDSNHVNTYSRGIKPWNMIRKPQRLKLKRCSVEYKLDTVLLQLKI